MPLINLSKVPQVKLLSHSSLENLHSCPRKFEIYRKNLAAKPEATIDTAFGHAVGVGIQTLLEITSVYSNFIPDNRYAELLTVLNPYQVAMWNMFLSWDVDFEEAKPKSKKAFHTALLAVEKYQQTILPFVIDDWELAYFDGKPAVELGFVIELPNGYYYRGYVDAVLYNRSTKSFRVLELKTTGLATTDVAQYRNSFQGVGYGVILDKLAADMEVSADYVVDYLVYKTGSQEFVPMPFTKTLRQRAAWLNQLLLETRVIDLYIETETFPMHGQSCYNYYRQCQYFGMCDKGNDLLCTGNNVSIPTNAEFISAWADAESLCTTGTGDGETKNNSIDTQNNFGYNTNTNKSDEEFFDFFISFDNLVARQYQALDAMSNEVASDAGFINELEASE